MSQIDHVYGMDWGDARYVGDGVYIRDCTDYSGIPAVALPDGPREPALRHRLGS